MAKKKVVESGWTYNGKPVNTFSDMPEGVIGFIYRIVNHDTGMYYIGRRTVAKNRRKKLTAKEKLLPANKGKSVKTEYCETSGWKSYCGSNTTLKEEVKNGATVTKEIIRYCFSKADITLQETKEILCSGALEDKMSYNSWIKATIYKKFLV